jgi:hypothetical protein
MPYRLAVTNVSVKRRAVTDVSVKRRAFVFLVKQPSITALLLGSKYWSSVWLSTRHNTRGDLIYTALLACSAVTWLAEGKRTLR